MKIFGTVKNSKDNAPVNDAAIKIIVNDQEIHSVQSDEKGEFQHETDSEYLNQTLFLTVEKDGFESKKFSYDIYSPILEVAILLDKGKPVEKKTEKIKKVYIEKPVYIEKEKIVEKPVYIEKEKIVEKPVIKPIYIERKEREKRWYIQLKDFITTNGTIMVHFLMDKISEHRRNEGRNKEVESIKVKLGAYKKKKELAEDEFQQIEKIIKNLESAMGADYISEKAFVDWNMEKIKPKRSPFKIEVWTEKAGARDILRVPEARSKKYHVGDNISINFKSEKDCYLVLLNLGTSGQLTVLFPNSYIKDNFIEANKIYSIPGEHTFNYRLSGPPGIEKIKAVASTKEFSLMDISFKEGEIFHTSESASRDISVVAKKIEDKELKGWAQAMCEIVVE